MSLSLTFRDSVIGGLYWEGQGLAGSFFFFFNFFMFFYFILKERQSVSRGGAEREGDTELEAGSRL